MHLHPVTPQDQNQTSAVAYLRRGVLWAACNDSTLLLENNFFTVVFPLNSYDPCYRNHLPFCVVLCQWRWADVPWGVRNVPTLTLIDGFLADGAMHLTVSVELWALRWYCEARVYLSFGKRVEMPIVYDDNKAFLCFELWGFESIFALMTVSDDWTWV